MFRKSHLQTQHRMSKPQALNLFSYWSPHSLQLLFQCNWDQLHWFAWFYSQRVALKLPITKGRAFDYQLRVFVAVRKTDITVYHPVQPTASVPGKTYSLATLHRDADILATVLGGWSTRSICERPETKHSFSSSCLPEGRAAAVPKTGSNGDHSCPPKKPGFWGKKCVSGRVLQAACPTHTLWFGGHMHILRFTISDNCALWNWKFIEYCLPTHFSDKEEILVLCLTELPSAFSSWIYKW